MRVLSAVALVCLCLPLAAGAQRGFAAHGPSAPSSGFHGSFAAPAHAGFGAAPRFGSTPVYRSPVYRAPYGSGLGLRSTPRSFYPPAYGGLRSPYTSSYGGLRVSPGRPRGVIYPRARSPWIAPLYPYPFFYNYSFLDPFWGLDDDNFLYGGASAYSPGTDAYAYAGQPYADQPYADQPYADQPYAAQPAAPYAGQVPDPSADQPADVYGPQAAGDSGPLVYAPYRSQPQGAGDAITVFFTDGRQPEQIRNYALTRSALLITGQRMREIPLAEIDLVRTERVNRALGVDFRLPQPN